VFQGTNISTGEEVAIKLECVKTKHPQLHIESKFYKMMQGGGDVCWYVYFTYVFLFRFAAGVSLKNNMWASWPKSQKLAEGSIMTVMLTPSICNRICLVRMAQVSVCHRDGTGRYHSSLRAVR